MIDIDMSESKSFRPRREVSGLIIDILKKSKKPMSSVELFMLILKKNPVMTQTRVTAALKGLRDVKPKLVYIDHWREHHEIKKFVAMHALGNKPCAIKPLTEKQVARKTASEKVRIDPKILEDMEFRCTAKEAATIAMAVQRGSAASFWQQI